MSPFRGAANSYYSCDIYNQPNGNKTAVGWVVWWSIHLVKIGYMKCHDLVLNSLAPNGLDVMG
jgi:hypothetical protein